MGWGKYNLQGKFSVLECVKSLKMALLHTVIIVTATVLSISGFLESVPEYEAKLKSLSS
jgi:hypothetical protein